MQTCKSRRHSGGLQKILSGRGRQMVTVATTRIWDARATNPHASASMIRMSHTFLAGDFASPGG